jgi:hypothetical protein
MARWMKSVIVAGLITGAAGCGGGPPNDARPPVESLSDGDVGLQAKDVDAATDMMVNSLLSAPALARSTTQWTIVLDKDHFTNSTGDVGYDYGVFVQLLQSKLAHFGAGRVTLIENKDAFHAEQSRELEGTPDPFGQGGGGTGNPAGNQPRYYLKITVGQMTNRTTDFFVINASVTDLQTRTQPWISPAYEVKTAR